MADEKLSSEDSYKSLAVSMVIGVPFNDYLEYEKKFHKIIEIANKQWNDEILPMISSENDNKNRLSLLTAYFSTLLSGMKDNNQLSVLLSTIIISRSNNGNVPALINIKIDELAQKLRNQDGR